jgi:hypothetical protein
VVHRTSSHPGEHAGIVEPALFAAVQAQLARNAGLGKRAALATAPLLGRLYDDAGNRMTPSHTNKGGVRYRYYVSCVLAQRRKGEGGSVLRVPAVEIEAAVLAALREARCAPGTSTEGATSSSGEELWGVLSRVTVHADHLAIAWSESADDETREVLAPWTRAPHRRLRRVITKEDVSGPERMRPIRAEARTRLLHAIARARRWVDQLVSGAVRSTAELAKQEGCSERSVRMTLNLAFLSPELVGAALDGRLPHRVGLTRLMDVPADWSAQRASIFGPLPPVLKKG